MRIQKLKKIIITSFTIVSSLYCWANIYASDYNYDGIELNNNPKNENTIENIKSAKLIKNYAEKLKKQLEELKIRYGAIENWRIEKHIKKLDTIIYVLQKIQTKNIEKHYFETIINNIIKQLKNLNEDAKIDVKNIIEDYETKLNQIKNMYYKLWSQLSIWLDKLIWNILNPLAKKKELNEKEKKLVNNLKNLKIENEKLKTLINNKNIAKEDLKIQLWNILKNIKKEIKEMRNIYKNN